MIEEDLFFPGKPIDDNDDVSTDAPISTKENMCSNGQMSTPLVDKKGAVQLPSETGKRHGAAC